MSLVRPTSLLIALLASQVAFGAAAAEADAAYAKARAGYYAFRQDAEEQKLRHKWQGAARPFTEVARRYPRSERAPEALFTAGMLFEELSLISRLPEDLDAAIETLAALVERHPGHRLSDDAAVRLAAMLTERRDEPEKARKWVTRALEAQPKGDQVRKLRAILAALPAPPKPAAVAKAPEPKPASVPRATVPKPASLAKAPVVTAPAAKPEPKPVAAIADAAPAGARPSTSHVIPRAERQARRVSTLAQAAAPVDLPSAEPEASPAVDAMAEAFRKLGPDTLRAAVDEATPPEPPAVTPGVAPETPGEGESGLVAAVSRFARQDAPRLFDDKADDAVQQKAARARLEAAAAANRGAELSLAEQLGLKVRRVVIDPGHGGHDPGAIGKKGTREKEIALAISKKLAVHLRKQGLEVLLTRDDDRYLKLEERTRFANDSQGDLFISIHCNASVNRKSHGIETYTLNISSDRYAIRLAARENASSEKSVSDLQFILADLATKANTGDSSRLAEHVQGSLVSHLGSKYDGIRDLGHKEALFYVLLGAKMPSILVETAFISNPEEEKRLATDAYQEELAVAISKGVQRFLGDRARLAKVD